MPISAAQFSDIAMALEGTTVKPHFDRIAFSVARTFATIAADKASANLLFTPEQQQGRCAIDPSIFAPVPNKWAAHGWTVITFANADPITAKAALQDAHQNSLKKKK